jgi:hypothetical protein
VDFVLDMQALEIADTDTADGPELLSVESGLSLLLCG